MRWLAFLGLAASMLAAGCASCDSRAPLDTGPDGAAGDGDVDHDVRDTDLDLHDDEMEADIDPDDFELDTGLFDGALPMDPTEIPHDRLGRDCGRGCTQISFAQPARPYSYDVGERYVTYRTAMSDISYSPFFYDLNTCKEYLLVSCDPYIGDPENCTTPSVYGNTIVFSTRLFSDTSDTPDMTLWRYRVGDAFRVPLVTRRMTDYYAPMLDFDVHQGMVAWWDSAIPPIGIYAMSLEGGEVIGLTRNECACYWYPHLWGREVAFESADGWYDISIVNIDTLARRNLNSDRVEQWYPAFDGRWVVWTDGRNDPSPSSINHQFNPDIFGMEMPDGEIEPLCDHPAAQTNPDVYLGLVAWEDFRNAEDPNDGNRWDTADVDIYLLDLETRREVQVTNLPGPEIAPRIWGRRLFFMARDLLDQWAIFMVDLDDAGLL
jgi:hypothetical protein